VEATVQTNITGTNIKSRDTESLDEYAFITDQQCLKLDLWGFQYLGRVSLKQPIERELIWTDE
jgi:hypothetical protein